MAAFPRFTKLVLALKLCGYFSRVSASTRHNRPSSVFGFHPAFGSTMVLQREPSAAQVYGILGNLTREHSTPVVTVTVTNTMATNAAEASYSVEAKIFTGGIWKALLKPTSAGGNFTIAAKCEGCSVTTATALRDITFGDVWYAAHEHAYQKVLQIFLTANCGVFIARHTLFLWCYCTGTVRASRIVSKLVRHEPHISLYASLINTKVISTFKICSI